MRAYFDANNGYPREKFIVPSSGIADDEVFKRIGITGM